jgi:hypothetical protein
MLQVLWFFDPGRTDPYHLDGRCLVRYKDGRVKQAVVPQQDARIPYAMAAHGVEVGDGWGVGRDKSCSRVSAVQGWLGGCGGVPSCSWQ